MHRKIHDNLHVSFLCSYGNFPLVLVLGPDEPASLGGILTDPLQDQMTRTMQRTNLGQRKIQSSKTSDGDSGDFTAQIRFKS